MNNDQLSIRFSDEIYASRSEVAKALGTNLIDGIWNNILVYRRAYIKATPLYDVSKARYQICYLKSLVEKINCLDDRLDNVSSLFNNLKDGSLEKINILSKQRKSELSAVAKILNIDVNDVALNNILNGTNVDQTYLPLVNYLKALNFVTNNSRRIIDVDFIAELYLLLSGNEELVSFYRVNDFDTYTQKAVIGREYIGVPVRLIEELMENLIDYILLDSEQFSLKASAIYYMMDYIKPFPKYNELMANLLVKAVLNNSKKLVGQILPFESILATKNERFKTLSKEVQKSRDLTYVLCFINEEMIYIIDSTINYINRLEVKETQNEYYRGDDPLAFKEEFGFDMPSFEEEVKLDSEDENVFEEIVEENPKESKDENDLLTKSEPLEETPKLDKPLTNQKIEKPVEKVIVNKVKPVKESSNIPINSSLDKEYKLQAIDMLESDPELRPHQAHFYVRHNTIGKFYTISQYKKCEGVVYETARTSMDNLAKKGYYKREQIKNKFVYTPIKLD